MADNEHKYVDSDMWSGYSAARERLLRLLSREKVSNPLVLSGDVHAFLANELKAPADADRPVAAVEFVTGSISARLEQREREPVVQSPCNENAVKYANLDNHGFSVCELTEDEAAVWFIGFPHEQGRLLKDPQEKKRILASFTVESGARDIKTNFRATELKVDNSLKGCGTREI